MRARTALIALVLLALLAGAAACRKEPTGTPDVVGETPTPTPTPEPTAAPEPTPTPLDSLALALEPVAAGFASPVFVTGSGDGSGRLFVLEQSGRVWIVRDGQRSAAPFLDLSAKVSSGGERGLLGMAFEPDFNGEGRVWVDYTETNGDTVISSFAVAGDAADPASEYIALTIQQPYANHNGGMIAFGPDGYLYVGMGDGGSGGDPQGNGQNLSVLLGKMLRLDAAAGPQASGGTPYAVPRDNPFVSHAGARPEIWAYGLRNPWRFSFDRKTGDLWIGDVGQNAWEEIDFQPAASAGGENYGWNEYEATHTYPPNSAVPAGAFTMPVLEYDRNTGTSVTGGYVYRGSAQQKFWGTYFYADYTYGRVWGAQRAADGSVATRLLLDIDGQISSFGEDDDGELYLIDYSGTVYRMIAG